MKKKIKKFRDIEKQAQQELQEELIEQKKELIKERIREIRAAQLVMKKLEKQYTDLLEKDIEDADD